MRKKRNCLSAFQQQTQQCAKPTEYSFASGLVWLAVWLSYRSMRSYLRILHCQIYVHMYEYDYPYYLEIAPVQTYYCPSHSAVSCRTAQYTTAAVHDSCRPPFWVWRNSKWRNGGVATGTSGWEEEQIQRTKYTPEESCTTEKQKCTSWTLQSDVHLSTSHARRFVYCLWYIWFWFVKFVEIETGLLLFLTCSCLYCIWCCGLSPLIRFEAIVLPVFLSWCDALSFRILLVRLTFKKGRRGWMPICSFLGIRSGALYLLFSIFIHRTFYIWPPAANNA